MEQPPSTPLAGDQMLKTKDVAEQLQISINTVHRLAESGELRSHRVGRLRRFKPADLDAYLSKVAEQTGPKPLRSSDVA